VVGALEILVTHPSQQRKIEYLNGRRIDWLEIKVSPESYTAPTAWTAGVPLEAVNYNKGIPVHIHGIINSLFFLVMQHIEFSYANANFRK
jgi:hypothetical protein